MQALYTAAMSDKPRQAPINPSQWKTLEQTTSRNRGRSTILSVVRQTPIGPLSPLIAAFITAVLIGATIYVGLTVRDSIRHRIRDSLETVLAANINALELWLAEQREAVEQLASDPQVRAAAEHRLADQPDAFSAPILSSKQTEQIESAGYLGWALIDPSGFVLESSRNDLRGKQFPLPRRLLDAITRGRASISTPFEIEVEDSENSSASTQALMCAIAPLEKGVFRAGLLALVIDPGRQFTQILSVAQMGRTGETYAFDANAVFISRSRFESQLVRAGLLAEGMASPLKVHIRNPGVDIREAEPAGNPKAWPMTVMADHATRGGQDFDVQGYADYRGVRVVGAWRWLAEHDFGVATEFDAEEAFAPLRILQNSFIALLALVMVAGITLFGIAWVTRPPETSSERKEDLSRRLGQYQLSQRIGKGGMGTVYLGSHGLLDRKVAIKVLENADATERALVRFQREVQLTARLKHPNTIEIYDFGRTDEGTFFYVMEFVEGISLEQLVDYYGRQPPERVIYLLLQVCGVDRRSARRRADPSRHQAGQRFVDCPIRTVRSD